MRGFERPIWSFKGVGSEERCKKRSGKAGKSLLKKTEEGMKINRSRGQQLSRHYIRRLREGMTFQSPMVFLQPSSYAYFICI